MRLLALRPSTWLQLRPSVGSSLALPRWASRAVVGLPAVASFVTYLATMAPSVVGLDSAELTTGAFTMGIVHPTGYPLFLLLARWALFLPIGSPAYRVNLVSAIFGALTIGLITLLARRLTGRLWTSWVAGLGLAVAPSFWRMSLIAEVYTLHTFFLAAIVLLVHITLTTGNRRWFMACVFMYGLSLSNHVSGVFYAPFLAWLAYRMRPARSSAPYLLQLAGWFTLGLSPYLYLPIRYAAGPALNYVRDYYHIDLRTPAGLWWMVSGQAYRIFSFGYDRAGYGGELVQFAALLWRNFTGLGVVLGVAGLGRGLVRRDPLARGGAFIFCAFALFFSGYAVADKETMFLPALALWSLWMAEGALAIASAVARWGEALAGVPSLFPRLLQGAILTTGVLAVGLRWNQVDLSQARQAETYGRQILASAPRQALVIGSWSSAVVLEYLQQVEQLRQDVEVFNRSRFEVAEYYLGWSRGQTHEAIMAGILARELSFVEEGFAEGRTVLSVEYNPWLGTAFRFAPAGTSFELSRRAETGLLAGSTEGPAAGAVQAIRRK